MAIKYLGSSHIPIPSPRHLKSSLLPGKRRATPQPIAPMKRKKSAHAICRCCRGSSNTGKETANPTEKGEKVVKREPSFTKVCPDELVAYSSFCDEHPWVFRVVLKLGAKTVNILLEGSSILRIPRSPYAVQEATMGNHLRLIPQQVTQDIVLSGCEPHQLSRDIDLMGGTIYGELVADKRQGVAVLEAEHAAATEHGIDFRQELYGHKGLADPAISARLERPYLIHSITPRRESDDGQIEEAANFGQNVETIDVEGTEVYDSDIRPLSFYEVCTVLALASPHQHCLWPPYPKRKRNISGQLLPIADNQNFHPSPKKNETHLPGRLPYSLHGTSAPTPGLRFLAPRLTC